MLRLFVVLYLSLLSVGLWPPALDVYMSLIDENQNPLLCLALHSVEIKLCVNRITNF